MYTLLPIADEIDQQGTWFHIWAWNERLALDITRDFYTSNNKKKIGWHAGVLYISDKRDKKQQERQQDVATFFFLVLYAHAPLRQHGSPAAATQREGK